MSTVKFTDIVSKADSFNRNAKNQVCKAVASGFFLISNNRTEKYCFTFKKFNVLVYKRIKVSYRIEYSLFVGYKIVVVGW